MRPYLSLTTLLILAIFTSGACNKKGGDERRAGTGKGAQQATAETPPEDGVRRIDVPELQLALAKGEAVVIDVRGSVEYNLGHIKGARSVPLGLIARQAKDLPRDKLIVAYCACTHEQLSVRAVQELKENGIENGAALVGGWTAWTEAGLPTETGE